MLSEIQTMILEKLRNCVEGLGFTEFLVWASEQKIDFADVAISPLVNDDWVKIDYAQGKYFLAT